MKNLTVPEQHQLKIAYKTLKMSDVGAFILGGMDRKKAKEVIKKLTGKEVKVKRNEKGQKRTV